MADATHHLGIYLFDDMEELDAVGPYEVLAAWTSYFPGDGWAVTGAKGLRVVPHGSVADAPVLDVLVYPGGVGTRARLADASHLDWVRAMRASTPLLASVC